MVIYDNIANMSIYSRVHPYIARVEQELQSLSGRELTTGRFPIEGDQLYYQVQRYESRNPSECRFESHRRYIDIQCVLEGRETAYITQIADVEPDDNYDGERDIRFYRDAEASAIVLRAGRFAIFFPQDAHKPCCHYAGNQVSILKVVFKLAI